MTTIAHPLFLALLTATALAFTATPAPAQFRASDAKLFIGWPDLELDPAPSSEAGAYAIVEEFGAVIYTITYSYKGARSVLGAFRCDKEFTVLETHSNGFRDIKCVRADVFGQRATTTLRFGIAGLYVEEF